MAWASIDEVDRAVAGQTVPRMFLKTVAAHGDAVALRCMDDDGGWKEWTFTTTRDQVAGRPPACEASASRPATRSC